MFLHQLTSNLFLSKSIVIIERKDFLLEDNRRNVYSQFVINKSTCQCGLMTFWRTCPSVQMFRDQNEHMVKLGTTQTAHNNKTGPNRFIFENCPSFMHLFRLYKSWGEYGPVSLCTPLFKAILDPLDEMNKYAGFIGISQCMVQIIVVNFDSSPIFQYRLVFDGLNISFYFALR